jgi:hypothetical protein
MIVVSLLQHLLVSVISGLFKALESLRILPVALEILSAVMSLAA